jgi:hypothetical protein
MSRVVLGLRWEVIPMPATPTKELPNASLSLEEQIRRRAHELSVERGDQPGSAFDDWLKAEEEILRARNDARVDEASEESFPSSDPPAH